MFDNVQIVEKNKLYHVPIKTDGRWCSWNYVIMILLK